MILELWLGKQVTETEYDVLIFYCGSMAYYGMSSCNRFSLLGVNKLNPLRYIYIYY